MTTKIRRSSGNVFKDLGFPTEQATNLKMRSDLLIRLSKLIDARVGQVGSRGAEMKTEDFDDLVESIREAGRLKRGQAKPSRARTSRR